jgi:hypothetical protein
VTAAELAAILATYGDTPVELNIVFDRGSDSRYRRYMEIRTNDRIHIELNATREKGVTSCSITAYASGLPQEIR